MSTAIVAAVLLAVSAVGLGLIVEPEVGALVALYGVITAAYSLILKRLVIIDVMTIGSLFILRVIAGAVAVEAQASEFLLICTGFLALFLGFTKRRQEALLEDTPAVVTGRGLLGSSGGVGCQSDRPVSPRSRALLPAVPRSDDRDGDGGVDHQLRHLRGQLTARRLAHVDHRARRSSTASFATST